MYYPVVRYLKQYTVVHQGQMNIQAPEIPWKYRMTDFTPIKLDKTRNNRLNAAAIK